MEIASIVASVASTILAIVAIGLSVLFYTQGKNSEVRVQMALEGIRAQTDALQKLTGRWMDRLTKYVTTPHEPMVETQSQLLLAIKELPKDIVSQLLVPSAQSQQPELLRECVSGYCALYYYTAIANYWAQFCLPPFEQFEDNSSYSEFIKNAVDQSYKDFQLLAGILERVDPSLLALNPLKHLVDKARDEYRHLIKDTMGVYTARAQRGESRTQE